MNEETLRLTASFPKDLILKNLGDWEYFEGYVLHDTTSRLIRMRTGKPFPELALNWSISSDMKYYCFDLREDAKFSEGTPITSKDVIFSLKRSLLHGGQYSPKYLSKIVGFENLSSVDSIIEGISAPSEHRIEIRLNSPSSSLLEDLGTLTFSVLPRNGVEEKNDIIHWDFRSSGVYKIKSYSSEEVLLEINPYHWQASEPGLIPLVRIARAGGGSAYDQMLREETDFAWTNTGATSVEELGKRGFLFRTGGPLVSFLSCDFKGPVFSKAPDIAKYLNLALDRLAIANEVNAKAGTRFSPVRIVNSGLDVLKEQEPLLHTESLISSARTSLAENYVGSKNGKSPFTIACSLGNVHRSAAAAAVATEIEKFGFFTKIIEKPLSELLQNSRDGSFDVALVSHGLEPRAPSESLQFLAGSNPERSNLPATHPVFEFNRTLADAVTYQQQVAKVEEYNKLNLASGFIIPLFESTSLYVFDSRFDIDGIPDNEENWRISEMRIRAIESNSCLSQGRRVE